ANDLARLAHHNFDRSPWIAKRRDPKQASGGARRRSRPRAGLFRSGGRHHLVMVGGIIPLRRATSSRFDGRLAQESAVRSLEVPAVLDQDKQDILQLWIKFAQ